MTSQKNVPFTLYIFVYVCDYILTNNKVGKYLFLEAEVHAL